MGNELREPPVTGNLSADFLLLLLREVIDIHLIAEGSGLCHDTPGMKRCAASRLVIRRGGDMGTHGADRIAVGSSALDIQALNGIRVIGAPDLGAVEQHAGIEAPAAARATFNHQVRIPGKKPGQQLIRAQDEPVGHLALPVRRKSMGKTVGNTAVEIPFHIFDTRFIQNIAHGLKQIIHHFLPGHIQHQLIPRHGGLSAGIGKRPVRMRPEQVRVLIDHFRLKPEPELQSECVDLLRELLHGAAQLSFIDDPVAQTGQVVVPAAEPSVIQHQHFHAQGAGTPGKLQELLRIEVKIGRLPAVEQHGTIGCTVSGINDMLADNPVEIAGQAVQSLTAACQDRLGRIKVLARIQAPGEPFRLKPGHHPDTARLTDLYLLQMPAGIHEHESPAPALVFRSRAVAEDDKRIVMMAGHAPLRPEGNLGMRQMQPLSGALHAVAPVEMDDIILSVGKIQTEGSRFFQCDRRTAGIDQTDGPGNHVTGREHMPEKLGFQAGHFILHRDHKRLRVLRFTDKGQPGQRHALFFCPVSLVAQIRAAAAVFADGPHSRGPVVSHARTGVFLGKRIQGKAAVASLFIRIPGKSPVSHADQVAHVRSGYWAVVKVEQDAAFRHLHLIEMMRRGQGKDPLLLIVDNAHD